jgi:hypothetical protein
MKLPEPVYDLVGTGHVYTESQLRQAIKDAYEDAAKVCESLFDKDDDSCNEAESCAEAIRNLKEEVN